MEIKIKNQLNCLIKELKNIEIYKENSTEKIPDVLITKEFFLKNSIEELKKRLLRIITIDFINKINHN